VVEARPTARRGQLKQLYLSNKEITVYFFKKMTNQKGPAFTRLGKENG
jgi:hypothetical protein